MKKRNLLIVEPGFRSYKEPILRAMAEDGECNLYVATGLHPQVPSDWARRYAKDVIHFSYPNGTLEAEVRRFARRRRMRFDGALTYIETSVHYVNELQYRLNMPVVSAFRGKQIRSKALMRELFARADVSQPSFRRVRSRAQLESVIAQTRRYPVILKPAEMMASLGVLQVDGAEDLRRSYDRVARADFWDENLRELYGDIGREVLVEEYIDGRQYSVETAVVDGVPRILGITGKDIESGRNFSELGHAFPARVPRVLGQRIVELITASHRALRLRNTMTHTEIRVRDGCPYLIEVNCRLAGDLISELMIRQGYPHLGAILVDVATGRPPCLDSCRRPGDRGVSRVAFVSTAREGRVTQMPPGRPGGEGHLGAAPGDLIFRDGLSGRSRLGHVFRDAGNLRPLQSITRRIERGFGIQAPTAVKRLPKADDTLLIFAANPGDKSAMQRIEAAAWPRALRADPATLRARLRRNAPNTLVAFSIRTREAVGFVSMVRVRGFDPADTRPWSHYARLAVGKARDFGAGPYDCLYVVSLSVDPKAPRGTGTALLEAADRLRKEQGLRFLAYGMRIPGFRRAAARGVSADEYLSQLKRGNGSEEYGFRAGVRAGGVPLRLEQNYYADPASRNFGVMFVHE